MKNIIKKFKQKIKDVHLTSIDISKLFENEYKISYLFFYPLLYISIFLSLKQQKNLK
jgi:hypothetical protein